jgi:Right handed beta helix region
VSRQRWVVAVAGVLAVVAVVAVVAPCTAAPAAGESSPAAVGSHRPASAGGATIAVPEDHATIQEAVDAAAPGDLILISPGVYHEAVNVEIPELTIRGLDRNEVILDGEFELDNGIRVLGAGGVAIENLTARNYTFNGFFWTGVDGYRGSYLTAYRNGDYGIYAFDSVNGLFEHSYAAGSPDAGFYIGECYPCDSVVNDVHAEHNGLGYSGTNSGGNLLIVNSRFNNNRAGIVPNSGSYELCYPQRETTIVGNLVDSNNQADTPATDEAILAMGNGILVAGGVRNDISRNRVWDHDITGIGLVPFPEEQALDDQPSSEEWDRPCADTKDDPVNTAPPELLLWEAHENVVTDNVVEDSGIADIAVGSLTADGSALANCFAGNMFTTSAPTDLEALAPCEGEGEGDWAAGALDLGALIAAADSAPPSVDYETAELPELEELEGMPDAETAAAAPATDMPVEVDLDAIEVPVAPVS